MERMMAEETPTTPGKQPDEPEASVPVAANDAGPAKPVADDAAALKAEVADMKDKLLRTLAEMENLRKRTEREVADQRQYAVASFARDMLTVGDNLRRAIEAVPKESRGSGDQALDALIEGVEMTERGLEQSLAKFGVRRVEAKGLKFDPSFHQAMFEVELPDAQPGTVADEIQAGYAIGERVLRPVMVSVVRKPRPPGAQAGRQAESEAAAEAAGESRGE
jgi:molecular chaperone GrpE